MGAGAAASAATEAPTIQDKEQQPASGGQKAEQQPAAAAQAAASAAEAPAAAPSGGHDPDKWEVNKPVERRCAALNAEASDCLACLWRWMTCGGPGARVRQLYINGRLSRCLDEYGRLKNCLLGKLDTDKVVTYLPGPHPLWKIRSRVQAEQFWGEQYGWLRGEGPPPEEREQQRLQQKGNSHSTGSSATIT